MGYRRASSTILVVIVAIFLLALDHSSVAHARQVRSPPSMSTGENPSTKEVLQATRKPGVEHSKVSTETVHMKPGSTGEAAAGVFGRRVEQPSLVRGGSSPAASVEKVVVVARYGPRPHPKKHN